MAHVRAIRQVVPVQRLNEVVFEPSDRLRDLLRRRPGSDEALELRPVWTCQQADGGCRGETRALVVRNDRKGRLVQDPASRAWLSLEDAEAVDRGLAAHDPARRGIGLKVVASMPMALDEISHIFSTAELSTAYGLRAHERVVDGEAGSGTVAPLEMTSTPNTDHGAFDAAVGADTAVSIHASSSTLCSLIAGLIVLNTGCSPRATEANSPKPFGVRVVQVQQRDVPLFQEWIGTLDGFVNADIKAQVSGYLVQQAYTEGSFVRKGQLLFQIDPRPFQATLDQVRAQLAQSLGQLEQARAQLVQAEAQVDVAEANRGRTQLDVDRYTPLARQEAITQQDLDNAIQNNLAAKAQLRAAEAQTHTAKAQITAAEAAVQSAKAAMATAQINLGFTRLASPIDGIPGIAELQVGALVSPASGTITTVSTLDPIKVYFTASEQRYLAFARRFPTATLRQADLQQWELELILSDGVLYPQKGRIYFADRRVDLKTGAIRLAGLFPNPGNSLRPGQYAKVRAATDVQRGALLVPQRAIMDLQGARQIAIVDGSNKVAIRTVTLGDTVGVDWIVREGAKPGERVVVEGLQKIRQGMLVDPQPDRNP